mgnify:CR=1 FL=1
MLRFFPLADKARFELAEGFALTRFRGVLLRPLGHLSIVLPENKQLDYFATALAIVKSSYEIFAMSAIVRRVLAAWMMRHVVRLAVAWASRELLRGLLYERACAGVCYSNNASSNDG